jgi:hypothetical protein
VSYTNCTKKEDMSIVIIIEEQGEKINHKEEKGKPKTDY